MSSSSVFSRFGDRLSNISPDSSNVSVERFTSLSSDTGDDDAGDVGNVGDDDDCGKTFASSASSALPERSSIVGAFLLSILLFFQREEDSDYPLACSLGLRLISRKDVVQNDDVLGGEKGDGQPWKDVGRGGGKGAGGQ